MPLCKTKKDTNMFQADSTQLKLLIYYINTVTAGPKGHNTRQNTTPVQSLISIIYQQNHATNKGSNVMARCKAGEESEDKDTETDLGPCTSQIT